MHLEWCEGNPTTAKHFLPNTDKSLTQGTGTLCLPRLFLRVSQHQHCFTGLYHPVLELVLSQPEEKSAFRLWREISGPPEGSAGGRSRLNPKKPHGHRGFQLLIWFRLKSYLPPQRWWNFCFLRQGWKQRTKTKNLTRTVSNIQTTDCFHRKLKNRETEVTLKKWIPNFVIKATWSAQVSAELERHNWLVLTKHHYWFHLWLCAFFLHLRTHPCVSVNGNCRAHLLT